MKQHVVYIYLYKVSTNIVKPQRALIKHYVGSATSFSFGIRPTHKVA